MGRMACALVIVLFVVACLIVVAANVFRPGPLVVRAMEAGLPGGDTIAYGWTSNCVYSPMAIGYAEYYSFVEWKHDGKTRRYYVFHGDQPLHPGQRPLEMRVSRDRKRIWLARTDTGKVCAALDLDTGEFRDALGYVRDPALPLREQVRRASGESAYPKWATPKGGELLASLTAQDYARLKLTRGR